METATKTRNKNRFRLHEIRLQVSRNYVGTQLILLFMKVK